MRCCPKHSHNLTCQFVVTNKDVQFSLFSPSKVMPTNFGFKLLPSCQCWKADLQTHVSVVAFHRIYVQIKWFVILPECVIKAVFLVVTKIISFRSLYTTFKYSFTAAFNAEIIWWNEMDKKKTGCPFVSICSCLQIISFLLKGLI